MDDDQVQQSLEQHSNRVDQQVAEFIASLGVVIELAQHRLNSYLLKTLALEAGVVARTPANIRLLRRLPQLWETSLDDAGLERAITAFTDLFPQQLQEFEQIIRVVNHAAKEPLPIPTFTQQDRNYFKAWQQSAAVDIATTVETPGAALRTAPGIGFKDLSKFITDKTATAVSRAETIADTSLMGYFRSVSGIGYEKIEAKLNKPLLYQYLGPDDQKTRPRCEVWLHQSARKPFTKDEIDKLEPDPGAPSPVMTFGGGFNCRHSWNINPKEIPA